MRLKRLRKELIKRGAIPYLITDLKNIKYLTGFSGSNGYLIVSEKNSIFISDSRYEEYAKSVIPEDCEFFLQEGNAFEAISSTIKKRGIKEIYVEASNITLAFHSELKKALSKVKIVPVIDDPVADLRAIKDENEISLIKEACAITDRCFAHLLQIIKPGVTEWDISVEIDYFFKRNGCRSCAFDPIVASGSGSSMPHYKPENKKIEPGEILLIDMGCVFQGYNSDLTRTIFIDKIDPALAEIYEIVFQAQSKALNAVKPGLDTGKLDSVARNFITQKGYGENFGHGLGHGVGIDIHESPAIKKNISSKLKKNMVITIEPGIYIPGRGGVRIEDTVLVSQQGFEVLTKSSKDLIVI